MQVEPEELCHVCSVYTGSETLVCGVCYRVFHQSCLAKIGQWSGPAELQDTGDMWSCHQCVSVVHLSQCWKNVSLVCECGAHVSVLEECVVSV